MFNFLRSCLVVEAGESFLEEVVRKLGPRGIAGIAGGGWTAEHRLSDES